MPPQRQPIIQILGPELRAIPIANKHDSGVSPKSQVSHSQEQPECYGPEAQRKQAAQ